RASANQLSLYGVLASFGGCNLCLCLINACQRFRDARILQLALAKIFLNAGARRPNCCFGLIHLRLIVIILQFDEEIALMYLLVVRHVNRAHDASHLGAERCKVTANVSIICDLFDLATLPSIPVPRDGDQNGESEQYHNEGSHVLLPSGTAARGSRGVDCGWRRARYRRSGLRRDWRSGH